MEFSEAKDLLLLGLLGFFGTYISTQIKELVQSVSDLNAKMSEVVTSLVGHKERLDDHAERIRQLESKI